MKYVLKDLAPRPEKDLFITQYWSDKQSDPPLHFHEDYMLSLTLNVRGTRITGRTADDFTEKDLIIIFPGVPHCYTRDEAYALYECTPVQELAAGLPTAISLAATDPQFAEDLQHLLHCGKSFRVYINPDFIGVQLGGAVKNVIAIGAGMSDGIGFGANARTALITRGLVEMSRLGAALGADPETFMGMAGLGDLVLTCTDNQSRNRRFGMMLGQGMDVQSAQDKIGQVVEGYRNTKEVRVLAQRLGVEMPITEEIYQVLYCGKIAREAALTLLGRARKDERSSN